MLKLTGEAKFELLNGSSKKKKKKFFFDTIGFQFLVRNVLGFFFFRICVLLGGWGLWEAGSWRKRRLQRTTEHRKAQRAGRLPD